MVSIVLLTMLVVGLLGGTALLTLGVLGTTFVALRGEEQATLEELEELGFECEGRTATGELSGHRMTARRTSDGAWLVTVEGLPPDLALRTSGTGTKSYRTGDRRIDSRWAIGSVEGGVGRLGRQARHVLARVRPVMDTFVLANGELTATVQSGVNLVDLLANFERLALELSGSPLDRLVETVRTDPNPRVRGHMLWELAQLDRDVAIETIERRNRDSSWGAEELLLMGELLGRAMFLERAMEHPDTTLKLAGRTLGAWLLLDEDIEPALSAMARRFGAEGLSVAADRIRGPHAHHAPALIPWISRVVRMPKRGAAAQRAAVSLVRSLQEARVRAALPDLVDAMNGLRGPAQLRAIQALGSMGDTDHVGPLRSAQTRLAVTDFQAQRAIEQAVASIQGRAYGQAGGLSLAMPTEGSGQLAIAPGPDDLAIAPLPDELAVAALPDDEAELEPQELESIPEDTDGAASPPTPSEPVPEAPR